MTSANPHNTAPESPKRPHHILRVLCIVNGPALTASGTATATQPAPTRPGRGWYVTRERWTVQL